MEHSVTMEKLCNVSNMETTRLLVYLGLEMWLVQLILNFKSSM